jgi:hypothetical protein
MLASGIVRNEALEVNGCLFGIACGDSGLSEAKQCGSGVRCAAVAQRNVEVGVFGILRARGEAAGDECGARGGLVVFLPTVERDPCLFDLAGSNE